MINKASRREFIMKSGLLGGVALFPGLVIQGCSAKKNGLSVTPVNAPDLLDKESWFVDNLANKDYHSLPDDPQFRYFSGFPAIKSVQPVPFSWGQENFYSGNGGYLTDNVYLEPGKTLGIATGDFHTRDRRYHHRFPTIQDVVPYFCRQWKNVLSLEASDHTRLHEYEPDCQCTNWKKWF